MRCEELSNRLGSPRVQHDRPDELTWAQSQLAARFLADPPLAFLRKPFRLEELVLLLEGLGLLAAPAPR